MNLWRLESDSIDAVRKLTASYVLRGDEINESVPSLVYKN